MAEFFCGMGNFRAGFEQAGWEIVYSCEWDKHKRRIYEVIYGEEPTSNDIRRVHGNDIPECECWTFGAPCQDFSIAGLRKGLDGDRSSLVREVFRLLKEKEPCDRPEWLVYENVKGMLSSNNGWDFAAIQAEMGGWGILLNGRYSTRRILEFHRIGKECILSDILEKDVDEKYFLSEQTTQRLLSYKDSSVEKLSGGGGERTAAESKRDAQIANTLTTRNPDACSTGVYPCKMGYKNGVTETQLSPTVMQRDYKGVSNQEIGGVIVGDEPERVLKGTKRR
jgi:hypothetical protein